MIDSVLSSGLQGIQSGISSARDAAQDIVRATTSDVGGEAVELATPAANEFVSQGQSGGALESITEAVVQLKVSEIQVKASAAVVRTADEVLGTLINTKA